MQEALKFEWESIQALNIMENTNKCLYLTWKAGAGKSTIINYYISKTKKKFVLLWTTGISAINIWGQTIHSFFWIIPNRKSTIKSETKEVIKDTDIFIIDEVSMMRADLFDRIEIIFRMVMWNDEFMWWKQVVFVWDLFQLPPVPERDEELKKYYDEKYKWLFFFNGNSFVKEHFEVVELKKVYRQDDPVFINMLNRMRVGDSSKDLIDYFNAKVVPEDQINPKAILIATTNAIVEKKNKQELNALPWKEEFSKAIIRGDYPSDSYPAEQYLNFKVWARIMFTVNDNQEFAYVNWTLWTITRVIYNWKGFVQSVDIVLDEGWEINIERKSWNHTDWEDVMWEPIVVWSFTQFPFKLAFAITIHKVQGKSFDNVIIDLGWGAFAEWQTYVAVSRCRNYWWLQLLKPLKKKDIKVSLNVLNFLKNVKTQPKNTLWE